MPNEIYHRSNWGESKAEDFGDVYYDHAATNKLYNHSDYYENSDGTDATLKDLNNKASIVLTPTAYSNGSLNTVIPPYQVLPTELVTNGDFSDGSTGWTHNNLSGTSTFSVSNNELTFTRGTFGDSFYQTDVAPAVAGVYLLTFDITAISGGSLRYSFSPNSAANTSNRVSANSVGSYSTSFVSDGTLLDFVFDLDSNGASVTIDNVSVKEVQEADFDFSRGSSATRVNEQGLVEDVQILSGELVQNGDFEQIGSELVTNGNFSDGLTGWNNNVSFPVDYLSVVDDRLELENINGGTQVFTSDSFSVTANKIYKISLDTIKVSGADDFDITLRNTPLGTTVETITTTQQTGELIYYFKSASTQSLVFQFTLRDTIKGSIDNVSVKEVGQNWTFGTGWSMGDGKAIGDGTMVSNVLEQDYDFIDGSLYRFTFTIKDYVSGSLFIRQPFNGSSDAVSANGTYTFDYVAGSTNSLKFRGNSFIGSIDDVSFKLVTDDTDLPRIDYTDGTGSLLLEPQRTNTFLYSEDYSQTNWIKNEITATANSIVSPDGSVNASLITITTSIPYLGQLQTLTTGTNYTMSAFVKKGTNRWVRLAYVSSSVTAAWFDLENNVVGTQSANSVSASIENYGNGWYRIINTFTAQQASGNAFLGLSDADNGTSASSSIGNTVYVWGFQMEEGSYATSYIPTSGSTVTRSADVANNSGNADLFNDSEGVLYAEISALSNTPDSSKFIAISDGTYNNRASILFSNGATNQIRTFLRVGGVPQIDVSDNVTDVTDFNKVAFSYKENDFKVYINGSLVSTDTSGSVWTLGTITKLSLSEISTSAGLFNGNVKSVAVFKEALTDAELQELTS